MRISHDARRMIAIPAIHLHHGLGALAGSRTQAQARMLAAELIRSLNRYGFARIHVEDLDAHRESAGRSRALSDLLSERFPALQVATGVRCADPLEDLLADGATYVVAAAGSRDDDWLVDFAHREAGSVIAHLDLCGRRLHARHDARRAALDALDWIEDVRDCALAGVIVAPVDASGVTAPNDLRLLEDMVELADCPIIAAGVVDGIGDMRALQDRGVAGVLLGDVLHDATIDPWLAAEEFSS